MLLNRFTLLEEHSGRLEGFEMKKNWWPQMVLILKLQLRVDAGLTRLSPSNFSQPRVEVKPTVYVAATHLKSNCDGHFEAVRTRQAAVLLQHLRDAGATTKDPVVICGDFNATPTAPFYAMYSYELEFFYLQHETS
jgi:endonuclease/exonuclease/phosphatase family metal-dependent hydrolase